MKAIYNRRLCTLGDNLNHAELTDLETGLVQTVSFGDPLLIVDPTDDEIADVEIADTMCDTGDK